jgi:8-oxo-dGTP diphosphatase
MRDNIMKIATLAIITRKRGGKKEILLGRKYSESEIGAGKLNGPGGKFDPREGDRTILGCLYREVIEEFGIFLNLREATKVAIITFYANSVPDFEVHVFRADSFSGKPRETKSMKKPEWHDTSSKPLL